MRLTNKLLWAWLFAAALPLAAFAQEKPSPKTPTPAEINAATQMLQAQVQAKPLTPPPIQLHRENAKDVPQDFEEHKAVVLPPTAQQALVTGIPWSTDLALPARGKDGRVLYSFGEAMPVVVCSPLRICVVELEAGEQLSGAPHLETPFAGTSPLKPPAPASPHIQYSC